MLIVPVLRGDQSPPGTTASSRPAAQVRLTRAEAAESAKDARAKVKVEMPNGVELTLWASERLIADPIAIDLDPDGTAYVISSSRADLPAAAAGPARKARAEKSASKRSGRTITKSSGRDAEACILIPEARGVTPPGLPASGTAH